MNTLYVLIGVSNSGKTTWAKEKIAQGAYYVSRDAERESIFGSYRMGNQKEEDVITHIVNSKINKLLRLGDVVLDNLNLRPETLEEIKTKFQHFNIEFVKMPEVPKEELVRRAQKRFFETGKLVPEHVLHKQLKRAEELEIPDNHEAINLKTDPRIGSRYNDMVEEQYCIIVDLDGTLALMNGRDPFRGQDCASDKVNESVRDLMALYRDIGYVFIFSGRNSDNGGEEATIKWLKDNEIPYDVLVMRKAGDSRADVTIKKEMFNEHIRDKFRVRFVLDDRDQVVKLWRNIGIDCFQVYYGDF